MSKLKSIDFKGFFQKLYKRIGSDKRLIALIIAIVVVIVLVITLALSIRPSIRHKQIESVGVIESKNKQVTTVLESDISQQLKEKDEHIVLIVDAKNNPSMQDMSTLLKENNELKETKWPIDYIQPVYDFKDVAKKYDLTKKNTFIVMENGKEKGRYAFNELSGGITTIDESLIKIIDPKLEEKKPIRVKVEEKVLEELDDSTPSERQKTEEIFFE